MASDQEGPPADASSHFQEHRILTRTKIRDILRESEKAAEITLLDYQWRAGAEKGENFSSEVVKCDVKALVDGQEKEFHWFAKVPLENPEELKFERDMRSEEKETAFYKDILPAWNDLAKERGATFALNCFAAPYTEFHEDPAKGSILIMQNLVHLGYEVAENKEQGLSLAHAKISLEEIARFHALGYAYLRSYAGGISEGLLANNALVTDYFLLEQTPEVKKAVDAISEGSLKNFYKLLEQIQEPGQDLVAAVRNFDEEHGAIRHRNKLYEADPQDFNTICHGDTWFNNILFQHSETAEGKVIPVSASMIDLSTTRYASPCTDLAYFLHNSTSPMLRETHLEHLLAHYHDTLVRCLHQLKEDPAVYPYRQLLQDYQKYCYVGFIMSLLVLPAIMSKKEDQEDVSGNFFDENTMDAFVANAGDTVKMFLRGNLMEMIHKGIIEMPTS